jgi:hypothetical protein
MSLTTVKGDAERVYRDWDDALGRKDVEAAIALYAPDCVLESPLVSHLLEHDPERWLPVFPKGTPSGARGIMLQQRSGAR